MQFLGILVLAFSPGIFWLWLICQRDKFRPEPRALVIRTFLWGMAVSIPISILESIMYPGEIDISQVSRLSLEAIAYISFIVAGVGTKKADLDFFFFAHGATNSR